MMTRLIPDGMARRATIRVAAGLALMAPCVVSAQSGSTGEISTGDTAWMLVSAALVLLMTPGLALFYAGMVRSKNVLSMLMQSFVSIAIVSVIWMLIGYSLAFSTGNSVLGGFGWVGLSGVGQVPYTFYGATVPHLVFMAYQMMFAVITPALISGAIADRMKFSAYCLFIAFWTLIVYAPLAHMVWGQGGFLRDLGALDFAGGTVVHISSGVSALVLSILLGKRHKGLMEDMRPHSLPLTLIGTGLLWFGWFGFNAGSSIGANGVAASAFVVTHMGAASAALAWLLLEWSAYKRPTALGLATGAVAGMVAVTPAAGYVTPGAAVVIGAIVSCISFYAIRLKDRFGYDDALDVFGVHGIGGMWGAIATGLFAAQSVNPAGANGLFNGGGFVLVLKQIAGIGVAVCVGVCGTLLIATALRRTIGIRVSFEEEDAGLDLSQHGESGYAGPSTGSDEGIGGALPSGQGAAH